MIGLVEYFLFQTVQEGQKNKKIYDIGIRSMYFFSLLPKKFEAIIAQKILFFVSKVKNKFLLLPKNVLFF